MPTPTHRNQSSSYARSRATPANHRVGRRRYADAVSSTTAGLGSIPRWWVATLATVTAAYIVSSQALTNVPGWSRLAVLLGALLVMLIAFGRLMDFCRLTPARWIILPAIFVGYCILRNLVGPVQERPMDRLFALVSAFLGGTGVAFALQAGVPFRILAYAQLAGGLCSMVADLYGFEAGILPGATEARYAGVTGNANELALQLTLGACLVWLLPRRAGLVACSFAFLTMGYAIATTGSRKTLLVLPIFLAFTLIHGVRALIRRRAWILGGSLAVLTLLAAAATPFVWPHLRDITAVRRVLEFDDSSFELRLGMSEQGLKIWQQSPLFGSGFAAFERLSGFATYAHNNYIELLCNTGLIGAVLFYACHLYIFVSAWRLSAKHRALVWLFTLLLLLLDVGLVSYDRKQSIMILLLLMSFASYREQPNARFREEPGARRPHPHTNPAHRDSFAPELPGQP